MKKMCMSSILIAILICTTSVYAVTIYEQHMDALWLWENANFPSREPQLINDETAIFFGENGVYGQWDDVLIEVPLTDSGVLISGCTITIDINAVPLPSTSPSHLEDEELKIGITDGINIVTFARSDNNNGGGVVFEYGYAIPQALEEEAHTLFDNVGSRPSVFSAVITLGESETTVWGQLDWATGTQITSRFISPTSAIRLVVVGDNDWEEYEITSIDVTIIPEPATILLLGLGAIALRRRKK